MLFCSGTLQNLFFFFIKSPVTGDNYWVMTEEAPKHSTHENSH